MVLPIKTKITLGGLGGLGFRCRVRIGSSLEDSKHLTGQLYSGKTDAWKDKLPGWHHNLIAVSNT